MSKHSITEQRLVLRTPGTDNVLVSLNVPFGDETTIDLRMDVYQPAGEADAPLPAVVFVTGYSDAETRFDAFSRVPMLIVRAGLDEMPGLNESIDRFVAWALRANLPVTVMNQPSGRHAFDVFDDNDDARTAIRRVIQFLRVHLRQ